MKRLFFLLTLLIFGIPAFAQLPYYGDFKVSGEVEAQSVSATDTIEAATIIFSVSDVYLFVEGLLEAADSGKALIYDATNNDIRLDWPSISALDDIQNVTVQTIQHGQVLGWSATENVWKATDTSAGGGVSDGTGTIYLTGEVSPVAGITTGDVVYFTKAMGTNYPLVSLADNTNSYAYRHIGIAQETKAQGESIQVAVAGLATNVSTTAFGGGSLLYLDDTAGNMTATKPSSTTEAVSIVGIVRSATDNGSVYIIPQFIGLSQIWDVSAAVKSNSWLLAWNSSTHVWEATSPEAVITTSLDNIADVTAQGMTHGQVLGWSATENTWEPTDTIVDTPTPLPTNMITGSGAAGITPVATYVFNVEVPTPVPTLAPQSTPTPMPTNIVTGSNVTPLATYQFNVDVPSTATPMPTNMVTGDYVTPIATYNFHLDYPTPLPTATPGVGGDIDNSYNVGGSYLSYPQDGQLLIYVPFTSDVIFLGNFYGSKIIAASAATDAATFTIYKNNEWLAYATVPAAGMEAVFTATASISFASGDILSLYAPDPADSTLGYLGINLAGYRQARNNEYNVAGTYLGAPDASEKIIYYPFTEDVMFPENMAGSHLVAVTAPTADAVFSIYQNDSIIGHATMAASATNASFDVQSATFITGDMLSIYAPDPADVSMDTIGFNLLGQRVNVETTYIIQPTPVNTPTPMFTPTPMPIDMVTGAYVTPLATYQFHVDVPTPEPTGTPWSIAAGEAIYVTGAATTYTINADIPYTPTPPPTPVNTPTPMPTSIVTGDYVTPVATYQFHVEPQPTADLSGYLPLAGGTMSGNINMGGNDITSVGKLEFPSNAGVINGAKITFYEGSNNDLLGFKLSNLLVDWVARGHTFNTYTNNCGLTTAEHTYDSFGYSNKITTSSIPASATYEFVSSSGGFLTNSHAYWAPYIIWRAGSAPVRISIESTADYGTTWIECVDDTDPQWNNNFWTPGKSSLVYYSAGIPNGIRFTLIFDDDTNTRYLAELGLSHSNIPLGYYSIPRLHKENTFTQNNNFTGGIDMGGNDITHIVNVGDTTDGEYITIDNTGNDIDFTAGGNTMLELQGDENRLQVNTDITASGGVNAATGYFTGEISAATVTDRTRYPADTFDALSAVAAVKATDVAGDWGRLDHASLPAALVRATTYPEQKYQITNKLTAGVEAEIPIRLVDNRTDIKDVKELIESVLFNFEKEKEEVTLSKEVINYPENFDAKLINGARIETGRDLGGTVSLNSKAISDLLKIVQKLQAQVTALEERVKKLEGVR